MCLCRSCLDLDRSVAQTSQPSSSSPLSFFLLSRLPFHLTLSSFKVTSTTTATQQPLCFFFFFFSLSFSVSFSGVFQQGHAKTKTKRTRRQHKQQATKQKTHPPTKAAHKHLVVDRNAAPSTRKEREDHRQSGTQQEVARSRTRRRQNDRGKEAIHRQAPKHFPHDRQLVSLRPHVPRLPFCRQTPPLFPQLYRDPPRQNHRLHPFSLSPFFSLQKKKKKTHILFSSSLDDGDVLLFSSPLLLMMMVVMGWKTKRSLPRERR